MNIGSLCTGYGGLDMALDGDTVWVSDIDKHAAKLLEHRFPTVPNLGDLTAVDWEAVEPVDIITAGYPCQPFSHAGKRGQSGVRHGMGMRSRFRRWRTAPTRAVIHPCYRHRLRAIGKTWGISRSRWRNRNCRTLSDTFLAEGITESK